METLNKKTLTTQNKFGYLLGGFPLTGMTIIISVTLVYFYTNILGLDIAKVSFIMLISRFLDGFSDAVGGIIINRTKSKHGSARAWILWTTIPYGLALILMFTVPVGSDPFKMFYIFLTYNFANTIVYTMSGIAVTAMTSLMTTNPKERVQLNVWRQFGASAFEMLVTAAVIPLTVALGGDQKAWIIVMAIFAVILMISNYICFKWTKELPPEALGDTSEEKPPVWLAIKSIISNPYWWIVLLTWGMIIYYLTFSGTIAAYFAQYVMGDVTMSSVILTAEKIAVLVSLITIVPLMVPRMSKRGMMMAGAIISGAGHLIVLIDPASVPIAVAASVLRGIGIGPCFGTITAFIADTIEYSHWKSGVRADAIGYSACTLGQKFNGGIAAYIFGAMMGAVGYDGTLAVQSEAATEMITNIYIFNPVVFYGIIIIFMLIYKLEKNIPAIMNDIHEGRIGANRSNL